jgi:hypothetical protein
MPDLTFDQKLKKMPPYIQEWMAEESTDINGEIAKKYNLNLEDTANMVWVISRVIIGDIKTEEFLNNLEERLPNLDKETLRKLAVDIVVKRFYPIRDFLEGAEALIKKLGGETPEGVELYSEKYKQMTIAMRQTLNDKELESHKDKKAGKSEEMDSEIIYISVGELFEKYPDIKNQFITSKHIHLKGKEELISATLPNWLEDYRGEMGAPPHSSMERAEYLFKSENTKNLDESERKILGVALKAYDEGGELPVDASSGKLVLSELFHQDTQILHGIETEQTQKQPSNVVDLRTNRK